MAGLCNGFICICVNDFIFLGHAIRPVRSAYAQAISASPSDCQKSALRPQGGFAHAHCRFVSDVRPALDFVQDPERPEHGSIERRAVKVSTQIKDYTVSPGVGQVPAGHREVTEARTSG